MKKLVFNTKYKKVFNYQYVSILILLAYYMLIYNFWKKRIGLSKK